MAEQTTDNLGKRKLFIRKEGRWEELVVQKHGRFDKDGRCSVCHCFSEIWTDAKVDYFYCPVCGAKMDKQEEPVEYDPDKFFGTNKGEER